MQDCQQNESQHRFDIQPDGSMLASMPAQLGYGAACKIINLLMVPYNAIGTAILVFVGPNLGADDHKRLKQGVWAAFWIGMDGYGLSDLPQRISCSFC